LREVGGRRRREAGDGGVREARGEGD
jgi:hypothetical protein